jgi:hypothetical protein
MILVSTVCRPAGQKNINITVIHSFIIDIRGTYQFYLHAVGILAYCTKMEENQRTSGRGEETGETDIGGETKESRRREREAGDT